VIVEALSGDRLVKIPIARSVSRVVTR
jgi:hypothetical protein